ncbi:MAG: Hsp20/alpha crystallin family protein [Thaumarchaeota archaeon]|nr:Hsp20/alpha crystallin family protein [Nitrososphaerota archaeon]
MSWPDRFRRRRFPFFDPDFFTDPFIKDIDDIMREMERRMEELFGEMSQKMPEKLIREKKLPDGTTVKEMGPFVYGYSVTIGPDGKPQISEFGNVKPSQKGKEYPVDVTEHREPLVEIVDQGNELRVLAEIPGVPKESLKIHATENSLSISAEHDSRRYAKELQLPEEVEPETARSKYNNGILEIILTKRKKGRPKGVPLRID